MSLRVLHLIYDDPGNPWVAGGGAVRVFEIYRRLTGRLASVTVATGAYPGSRDETIEGVRYVRLGSATPYYWSRATFTWHASRLLVRGDYDVAVFDFSTYAPIRIPPDQPVGITVHHVTGSSATERWGPVAGRAIGWQERARLERGRVFSATSMATEHRLREITGDTATIVRVGAGVPDELFDLPRADEGYMLYFGRFDWFQKGLDTLLEAVSIIVRERPDTRLLMAGRGRDAARVVEAARALGIAGNLDVLGTVESAERDRLLGGAALALMPSRFEGFGMVAAEAMAAGIPLIASCVDSLPEVVDPPHGGILVPPADPGALATAALGLLADPAKRERLSRTARESAERFRWSRVADDHLDFLWAIRSRWLPHNG